MYDIAGKFRFWVALAASCLSALFQCLPAQAADASADKDRWVFAAEIFALAADMGASSSAGDDIEADFDDVLDSLHFGAMGSLAAQRNRLTLFGDFIYLDIEDKKRRKLGDGNTSIPAKLEAAMQGLISTLGVGYRVIEGESSSMSVVGGARYLSLDTEIKLALDSSTIAKVSESGSNWDAVVGLRGQFDLGESWYVHYYGDVGAGESEITWQALGGINYRFTALDLTLGYSFMAWRFDDDSLLQDLKINGPYLGIKFRI